ncbi:armadillo-type protein [Sporodiniella umbellata]|nr:armadillo-type protein [Sporodiniella umbellata]
MNRTIEVLHQGGIQSAERLVMTTLEFCALVPEEVSHADLMGGCKLQLMEELKQSTPLVLSQLSTYLCSENATLRSKSLQALQSWIQYGISLEDVYPLLQKTMQMLTDEDVFEEAVEVLLEAMQHSKWAKYQTLRSDLLLCFTGEPIKIKFDACIQNQDEETAKLLAKLFCTFGETYSDHVCKELIHPYVSTLMRMIMQLTAYQGYFPVDQEVSEIPLNFWYVLQETLFDEEVLPVKSENNVNGMAAIMLYNELVLILVKSARYPDDATWSTWNKDSKDKFRTWRRDLGDAMINPYLAVKENMLAILLEHMSQILNEWNTLPNSSQELEAALFCLKSISEEIHQKESDYVHPFFGEQVLGRLPSECSNRLKVTVLALFGSFSEWLKPHPELLSPVMNYIAPCLSDTTLAPVASTAFSEICNDCRESLVGDLDTLMQIYATMAKSNIKPAILQKVVESVADVIQVLPAERAVASLMSLVGDILQGLDAALNGNPDTVRENILYRIQYLSACCRGIQSPNDSYQSLRGLLSVYDGFARGEAAEVYSKVEGFNEMNYAISVSVQQMAVFVVDEEIAKALSHFLNVGIKSTSPLLSLKFEELTMLVESAYTTAPFPCWLDTASLIINVYGSQPVFCERLRNLLGALTNKTLEIIHGTEDMENQPDIVDSYFGLLTRVSSSIL